MNTTIRKRLLVAAAAITGFGLALSASAQTGLNVSATTGTTGTGSTAVSANANTKTEAGLATMIAAGDKGITTRISALTTLNTRIQGMQKVSASEKASLSAGLQAEISALTTLKAKIDADTTVAVLKTDLGSVTKSYRIYLLVLPQGVMTANADRILNISDAMTTIGTKIQTRISELPAGSNTVSITATLSDYNAKISAAAAQANAAVSGIANLAPDNGNTTVAASNRTALLAAKASLKTAATDLTAARKDAGTMVADLKAFEKTSASSSTSTSASTSTGQ